MNTWRDDAWAIMMAAWIILALYGAFDLIRRILWN